MSSSPEEEEEEEVSMEFDDSMEGDGSEVEEEEMDEPEVDTREMPCSSKGGASHPSDEILQRGGTGKRKYECSHCNKAFARKSKLEDHERTHTGEKPFLCTYEKCGKAFAAQSNLREHELTHTGVKPFPCDVCKRRFARKSQLKVHELTHTGVKSFLCEICKKAFATKSKLEIHALTHTGEKPFRCDVCKQRFATKSQLKVHELTHTGVKPFPCDVCKQRFAEKGNLKKHQRTHTGEKPFSCEICKKEFTRSSSLRVHEKNMHPASGEQAIMPEERTASPSSSNSSDAIHDPEDTKPFLCDVCKQGCAERQELDRHQWWIHEKENSLGCGPCKKKFARYFEWAQHRQEKHGIDEKPYLCKECQIPFRIESMYKVHMWRHTIDTSPALSAIEEEDQLLVGMQAYPHLVTHMRKYPTPDKGLCEYRYLEQRNQYAYERCDDALRKKFQEFLDHREGQHCRKDLLDVQKVEEDDPRKGLRKVRQGCG